MDSRQAFESNGLTGERLAVSKLALLLVLYACAFILLHDMAAFWGVGTVYSLWFPPAGLRFALLWHFGARLTLPLALTELTAQAVLGRVALGTGEDLLFAASIVCPPLAYGGAVLLVRWRSPKDRTALGVAPMPLGLAAVLAPVLGSLASLPWHILRGTSPAMDALPDAVASIVVFTLGDLLGVLLLAPPLLWLFSTFPRIPATPVPRWHQWPETVVVLLLGWGAVVTIYSAGLGIRLHPILLATIWLGLRFGRMAAWIAIFIACLVALPLPAGIFEDGQRITVHMMLACIAIGGYLVGSYSEAEASLRRDLDRRDRLLFHAERLKTLRAMSVAIIHEISQPLATLSIEARYLARASADENTKRAELSSAAALIERKTTHLAEMVRRLRSFGGRGGDAPSLIPVESLVRDVVGVVSPEAEAANVKLKVVPAAELLVRGQEIELQQALTNLVRNAILASPGRTVAISARDDGPGTICIDVINKPVGGHTRTHGMGVGLIVARTIADAHGGRLAEEASAKGERRFSLILPGQEGVLDDAVEGN
jgi:signal transduction histidine kinase